MVVAFQADRAHIRFHDGQTYAMPADPLRKAGIALGKSFFLVTTWAGKVAVESHIEPVAEPRPQLASKPMPKVQLRDGQKLTTRR